MGFVVLHMEKAHGSDSGTTAHIERFIIPKNADPTRTHLNRRLIEYPDGVKDRSAAIQQRLEEAGLTRKIGSNQVRAPHQRIGNARGHEADKGRGTFGRVVRRQSEILRRHVRKGEHRGGSPAQGRGNAPHIHVTLVPIVKGERKRRKREEQTKKRYRKKPTDTVRLCADDIMTRLKLKSYQDTYAVAMAKYGLQRGIDGSKARHKSTQQYYRDIQKLSDDLKAEVVDLQQQKETAQEELRRAKKEIQTEKLKGAATTAAANIAESVGSLFGSNKVKTLERENTALHKEVADHEETIEALQDRIQTMQADHSREIREMQQKHGREIADKDTRHKQEISFLKTVIARAAAWFPYFREMLRIENLCRLVGFDERQTATLVKGKPLEYAGELYSEEHGRKFTTERAGFQVLKDPTDGTKLVLAIDRKPIAEWFKEQFEKLRQNIRRPIQPQRKGKGFKL